MKLLFSSLVLAFAFAGSSIASADCSGSLVGDCNHEEQPNYRMCRAHDANGNEWRYYTSFWNPKQYTQRKAVEKCRANSSAPRSCRAAGCREW